MFFYIMINRQLNQAALKTFLLQKAVIFFSLLFTLDISFAAEGVLTAPNSAWLWIGAGFAGGAFISGILIYYFMAHRHRTEARSADQKKVLPAKTVTVSQDKKKTTDTDPCSECITILPGNNASGINRTGGDKQGRILIVEDDQVCLDMMVAFLKSENYDILTAENGMDALKIIKKTIPDLILLDLIMPGKSGFDVCREIRLQYSSSQVPIIILTVQNRMKDLLKGFELGANDYLIKPITNKELIARVKTHITIRRSDMALRESEEKYRQFFENVFDFWFVHDLEGSFIETNLNLKKQWGYTEKEQIPSNIKQLVSPSFQNKVDNYLTFVIKHGQAEGIVRCNTHDGDEKFMNYRSVLVKNDEGNPLYIRGTARDITERITVKKEKNELEKQVRQSQKMEAIGSLAGGIAHDFNNTLFPIVGYTEMALSLTNEDSPVKEYLEEVLHASTRAAKLIDQILSFSRKNEAAPRPLHVQPMLKESVRMLQSSLPSTVEIRHNIENHEDNILGDPVQIHQMFMNLCTNAYQAMGENGGVLEIKLTPETIDAVKHSSRAKGMKAGLYYHLSISDTGCGISPELVDRIFDPYFTTKNQGTTTGIGLSVVHQIVKNMKGYISVSTRTGSGSTFDIYLPRLQSAENEEAVSDTESMPGGREKILLVDDEQQIVKMMRQMIEPLGYDVTVRYSSLDALEAFRAAPDQYHLVMTDQTMPNMTGIMLCQQIRKIRSDIRLILCSGQNEPSPALKPLLKSIDGYIKKPARRRELAFALRNVLDGRPVKPFEQTDPVSAAPTSQPV